MELAVAAQQAAGATLLGTALLLGVRHGIDWDHIAAIMDIASTTTSVEVAETTPTTATSPTAAADGVRVRPVARVHALGSADPAVAVGRPQPSFLQLEARAFWLSFLYALGHATVVTALGGAALSFATVLPDWIDPIMERVVGVTLVMLGIWLLYSLVQYLRGAGDFRLQSRWMLVFAGARHAVARIKAWLHGHEHTGSFRVEQYGPRTAYGVGMIHGIGAETGTQVLIIAAVGGAASQGLGVGMMLAFVVGLLISNTLIALLAATGFISSVHARPFYVAIGALTAVFSLVIGAYFVLGVGSELPDLNEVFGFIGSGAGE